MDYNTSWHHKRGHLKSIWPLRSDMRPIWVKYA